MQPANGCRRPLACNVACRFFRIFADEGFGLLDLGLIERSHVHEALGRPRSAGDVVKPRCCEVEAGLAVRERATTRMRRRIISHDALERIVVAEIVPMNVGKA